MSSATSTYQESVASSRPPTPATPPPPPAAPRGVPVRRHLDFADDGGDLDEGDLLWRVADKMERRCSEAKRAAAKAQAPWCICGRDVCGVEQDERGRWVYVCSSRPKCKHVALCEEVDLHPKSSPAFRSHPKSSNPRVFNVPSNHVADARTLINYVTPRGAGATTPINARPLGAVATTPVNVSPQGTGGTTPVKFSTQGARSNSERPICQCTAGRCKVLRMGNKDCYVCPIPKGQGACSHKVPVHAAVSKPPQTGNNNISGKNKHLKENPVEKEAHGNNLVQVGVNNANGLLNPAGPEDDEWPFDIVDNETVPTAQPKPCNEIRQEPHSMLHQPIAVVETPTKSPMTPNSTLPPMPRKGHWTSDCPKLTPGSSTCYQCGMVGHWKADCPLLRHRRGL